ncbi:hypothetical protein [uncultured Clostridium sp.]|uniref:hypothetical protein n=1 Tax=uncultured Clostridium sp. TaxID=59620 RepID=UPI003216CD3C
MIDLDYLKYIKTINGTNGTTSEKQVLINEMVADYNEANKSLIKRFSVIINTDDGKNVYINDSNIPIRGVIDIKRKQGAKSEMEQVIQTHPNIIKSGDVLKFKINETDEYHDYIITSKIEKKKGYDEGIILQCNQHFNLKGWDKPIPCWGDNTSYGVKGKIDTNYFTTTDGKFQFKIQKNKYTDMLDKDIRLIFNHKYAYKIVECENIKDENIYVITVEKDEILAKDDLVNNIAYNSSLEVEAPINPNPNPDYSYNVMADSGDLSLKRYNTNTFRVVDTYGNNVSGIWTITIDYNGIPESYITIKETGSNYIKLINTKGYNTLPIKIKFKKDLNLLMQEVRLIN